METLEKRKEFLERLEKIIDFCIEQEPDFLPTIHLDKESEKVFTNLMVDAYHERIKNEDLKKLLFQAEGTSQNYRQCPINWSAPFFYVGPPMVRINSAVPTRYEMHDALMKIKEKAEKNHRFCEEIIELSKIE